MSDISSLDTRITAALDRIRAGLDKRPAADDAESGVMQDALDKERAANAELTRRVQLLKERQDTQVASLTSRVESQLAQLGALDAELQKLRTANLQLREANAKLRQAASGGLSPADYDASLAADVASLEAQRTADAAELDAIISELKPLIAEA